MNSDGRSSAGWFRQSFGELYPLIYAHRSTDAAEREIVAMSRWVPLARNDRVLDVCCGTGRHMVALLALGCDVVGFDLSGELLDAAKQRTVLRGRLFQGDIRRIPVDRCFDRVLNLFTSFGYFQADRDNLAAFEAMARLVDRRGVLILDHMHAARIRRTLIPESVSERAGYRIVEYRRIDGSRVRKRIEVTRIGDGIPHSFQEDVRMYAPREMIEMARGAGFTSVTLHGSFTGEPFGANSERMILRAQRD